MTMTDSAGGEALLVRNRAREKRLLGGHRGCLLVCSHACVHVRAVPWAGGRAHI